MTDIVERLRELSRHARDNLTIGYEAADEIERLMSEVGESEGAESVWRKRALQAEAEVAALRALLMRAKVTLTDVAYPDGELCVNPDAEEMASAIDAALAKEET